MELAIREFGNSLKFPDAVGLFYYSGHGAQAEGQNYILPVDADIQDIDELRYKAVDAESILAKMRSAGNRLNIVVLDACRNNPYRGATRSAERGLSVVKVKVPESLIVYATDPGSTAADGDGRNSPFTQSFLAQMEIPGQDIAQMMKRVTSAVRDATKGAQTPWVSSNLTSDFSFRTADQGQVHSDQASAAVPTMSVARSYGSLVVSSASAGLLYLDGAAMGDLPAGASARLDNLDAGEHSLELRYPSGNKEARNVTVRKESSSTVVFAWKKAEPARDNLSVGSDGLVRLPAGSFAMGGGYGASTKPVHEVLVSAFSIGKYEVTQGEWTSIMGSNPSKFKGDNRLPVEQVSWYECLVYCNKRSAKEGLLPCYAIAGSSDTKRWGPAPSGVSPTWNAVTCDFSANGYRLPTEAEWEYACRAGTTTATAFGDMLASTQANFVGYQPYKISTKGPNLKKTSIVGGYSPNPWGLFDMHGNVWEWCWDWFGEYSAEAQNDPTGPSLGGGRIERGGSWSSGGENCLSGFRLFASPDLKLSGAGFRLARRP